MKRTYIIAEIGINHNGDIEIAKRLIDVAIVAGCDAVKFQKREPDICVPEHQKGVMRETPWGEMTYLDYKKRIEFGKNEYDEIDRYCNERGIEWSASVWDEMSLDFLMQYDVPWIKIPSAMATNSTLLDKAQGTGKKLLISTGMCTEDEVRSIVKQCALWWEQTAIQHVIMHTNSTYPSSIDDLNLAYIKRLQTMSMRELANELYPLFEVGYSGHEFGLITTMASIYLGATYIERHITLDRSMWGTDQLASVGPKGLMELVSGVRELERAYGSHHVDRVLTDAEMVVRRKLRGV